MSLPYSTRFLTLLVAVGFVMSMPGRAENDVKAKPDTGGTPTEKQAAGESRISADQVEMDLKKGVAMFSGNVLISDSSMSLNCDVMTVHFSEKQKISRVEADGHVVIVEPREKRKATAAKAVYDLEKGEIRLLGDPVLEMADRKMYNADVINYNLKTGKASTESRNGRRPVIEFKVDGGGLSLDALDLGGGTSGGGAAKPDDAKEVEKREESGTNE